MNLKELPTPSIKDIQKFPVLPTNGSTQICSPSIHQTVQPPTSLAGLFVPSTKDTQNLPILGNPEYPNITYHIGVLHDWLGDDLLLNRHDLLVDRLHDLLVDGRRCHLQHRCRCGVDRWRTLGDDGVEAVHRVGGVVDGTHGTVGLHQGVLTLDYITVTTLRLGLVVAGVRVRHAVLEGVFGVGLSSTTIFKLYKYR